MNCQNAIRSAILSGLACLLPLPAVATPASRLLLVYPDGRSVESRDARTSGLKAACADPDLLFALRETVLPSSAIAVQEAAADIALQIEVEVPCGSLAGSASLDYRVADGSATPGEDFLAPAPALVALTLDPDGTSASSAALVIRILDDRLTESDETIPIVRGAMNFFGTVAGTPVAGSLPPSPALAGITIQAHSDQATEADLEDALDQVSPLADAAARPVIEAVIAFCELQQEGHGAAREGCDAIDLAAAIANDPEEPAALRLRAAGVVEEQLLAIANDESTAVSKTAPQVVSAQLSNVAARLAALRGGATGLSLDGLAFNVDGVPLSLGLLQDAADEASGRNEERRTLLGGTRWGLWFNGTLGGGDRDRLDGESGFDFDSRSLTGGMDYRFNERWFAGAALGWSDFDADLELDQGRLDASGWALHAYSGYSHPSGLTLDASISHLDTRYRQQRLVELPQIDRSGTVSVLFSDSARSSTDARQLAASLALAYNLMRADWTLAPQASLEYERTTIDGFTERGDSPFNLAVDDHRFSTRSLNLGLYIDRAFATASGLFRPYGRATYTFESGRSRFSLLSRFVDAAGQPSLPPLVVFINEPDRRYATIEAGLAYARPIGTRTVDFNLGVLQVVGFEALDRWQVRGDLRIPF